MSTSTAETISTHREQAEAFSSNFSGGKRIAVLHGYIAGADIASVSTSKDILDVIREAQAIAHWSDNPVTVATAGMDEFVVGASFGIIAERTRIA